MDRCHMFLRLPKRSDLPLCLICSRDVLLFYGCWILSQCLLQGTSFSLNFLLCTRYPRETHAVPLRLDRFDGIDGSGESRKSAMCLTSKHVRGTRETVAARFSEIFRIFPFYMTFFPQIFYIRAPYFFLIIFVTRMKR